MFQYFMIQLYFMNVSIFYDSTFMIQTSKKKQQKTSKKSLCLAKYSMFLSFKHDLTSKNIEPANSLRLSMLSFRKVNVSSSLAT